jgi:hypothetical protein
MDDTSLKSSSVVNDKDQSVQIKSLEGSLEED